MQSQVSEEAQNTLVQAIQKKKVVLIGVLIFLFTLVLVLYFHFDSEPPHRTLCFDARQYFFDTGRITEFILAALHGHWQPQLLSEPVFLASILSDGPVLPTFFGILLAFSGHVPSIQDCKLVEILQTVMHSCSASLIYGLTFAFTRRLLPAVSASLAWGLYPAAIFWSGIFYTETTVVFFSLIFVSCLAMSERLAAAFFAGISAAIVALLKPALLPAAALSSLLSYRLNKRSFFLLALAIVLAVAPWLLYTKALTGHARITAQRFPAFNLAMGADTEVEACLVSPAPPLTTMFSRDDDMPLAFPLSQWQYHTIDCLRLSAVKLSALLSRQANDFRQKIFGIEPAAQNIWHLFLVFSGICGAFYFILSCRMSKQTKEAQTIGLASLVFVFCHLGYILFTPAARYGLTSIPFLVIFAAFAMHQTLSPHALKERINFVICALAAALLVHGLINGSSLSNIFRQEEIVHQLSPGDTATKYINLNAVKKTLSPIYSVLLLVDGDTAIENADIEFNKHMLSGHLQHIRNFDSILYLQSFELRSLGYPAGISTDQFRHWRAISVPADWINWAGPNEIKLRAENTPAIIYGEAASNRHMLAIDYFSVNSLCNSEKSLDLRVPSPILTGNVSGSSSLLKYKSHSESILADSLRVKIAVVLGIPFQANQQKPTPICAATISPKKFDLYIQDPVVNGVRANRVNIKAARSMGTVVDLPDIGRASTLRLRVEGDLRGISKGNAEVVVALQPSLQGSALVLNMSPQNIEFNKDWRHFAIEDMVPTKLLAENKKHSLYLAVYPGPWLDYCGYTADKHCGDAQFRNIRFVMSSEDKPDIAGKRILFY